jgi:hypothetical protein
MKNKDNDNSWMYVGLGIIGIIILYNLFPGLFKWGDGGGGSSDSYDPVRPGMGGYNDEIQAEMQDALEMPEYDPAMKYDDEISAQETQDYLEWKYEATREAERYGAGSSESKCPYGCRNHEPGCDIKGNISIETDEKIFHVPGQKYYQQTNISPQYGERWFCTEAEARANGWRKAFE